MEAGSERIPRVEEHMRRGNYSPCHEVEGEIIYHNKETQRKFDFENALALVSQQLSGSRYMHLAGALTHRIVSSSLGTY